MVQIIKKNFFPFASFVEELFGICYTHNLYTIDKHGSFREYYGLVINVYENFITQAGPYGAGYQRNRNYMCIVNKHDIAGTIIKGWYQIPNAGFKTMLVCYPLTPPLCHVCLHFLSAAAAILLGILQEKFSRKSWLERFIQLPFMRVCKYLNQTVKIFQGFLIENWIHNSIQDWIFTNVYQLQKSAWKNARLFKNLGEIAWFILLLNINQWNWNLHHTKNIMEKPYYHWTRCLFFQYSCFILRNAW